MDDSLRSGYSYSYSRDVVYDFIDCYTRATYFVAKVFGWNAKALADVLIKHFMTDQWRWRVCRDTIKAVEKQNLYAEIRGMEPDIAQKYLNLLYECAKQDNLPADGAEYSIDGQLDFS